MRREGFTDTLLGILKNSVITGVFIVAMTVLLGILKHTSGASYIVALTLMIAATSSMFVYIKNEALRRK